MGARAFNHFIKILAMPKGHTEMTGVHFGLLIDFVGREVANDLIAEEVEGDTVIIATGKPES